MERSFECANLNHYACIAGSGVLHVAKCEQHSLVHFVLNTKMAMPPTFSRVRYLSTFLYGTGT
jgi:hypothetical protein